MKPGREVSRETADRLEAFEALLLERAIPLGLISGADRRHLRDRHILDSLRAADALRAEDRSCFDIGSGAGLPGLALAIALPHRSFALIESQRRRVGFLELVVERLSLTNVEVVPERVEVVGEHVSSGVRPPADAVTARAFAPLPRSWALAAPLLRPGGRLVYFAGSGMRDPEGAAKEAAGGDVDVEVLRMLDSPTPLVIMTR